MLLVIYVPSKPPCIKTVTALAVAPQQMNQAETNRLVESLSGQGLAFRDGCGRTRVAKLTESNQRWAAGERRCTRVACRMDDGIQGAKGNVDIKLEGVPDGMLQDGDKVVVLGRSKMLRHPRR